MPHKSSRYSQLATKMETDNRQSIWTCGLALAAIAVLITALAGCSPQKYIFSADKDAICLINNASQDERWLITDYRFLPDPDSRLYMDYYQETPCQPQDDPASHEYMKCVNGYRGWKGWDKYGYETTTDSRNWLKYMESENGVVGTEIQSGSSAVLFHLVDNQNGF